MKVLFWGIFLFWAAFFVHVLVWKIHLPKRQTKTLLQIFFATLIVGLFTLWSAKCILPWSTNFLLSMGEDFLDKNIS